MFYISNKYAYMHACLIICEMYKKKCIKHRKSWFARTRFLEFILIKTFISKSHRYRTLTSKIYISFKESRVSVTYNDSVVLRFV